MNTTIVYLFAIRNVNMRIGIVGECQFNLVTFTLPFISQSTIETNTL